MPPPQAPSPTRNSVRNHAKVMVACDFFVVIIAAFRTLYVFVVMEIGSRQILHLNAQPIPRRNRRRSSSGKRCRATIPTASSSTIATADSLRISRGILQIDLWRQQLDGRQRPSSLVSTRYGRRLSGLCGQLGLGRFLTDLP
jgi:hypothetical protein